MSTYSWQSPLHRGALRAILVTAASLVLILGSLTSSASASELVNSDPIPGAVLELPLESVTLTFDAPVAIATDGIVVTADAEPVAIGDVEFFEGGLTYVVFLAESVTDAVVDVSWTASDAAGEPAAGTLRFTVGEAAPPVAFPDLTEELAAQEADASAPDAEEAVAPVESGADDSIVIADAPEPRDIETVQEPAPSRSRLTTVLATLSRSVATSAAMVVIGGFVFLSVLHKGTTQERHLLVRVYQVAAMVLLTGSIVAFAARAGELQGSIFSMFDPREWWSLARTRFGAGTFLRLVGAGALVAGAKRWLVGLSLFEHERRQPVPQSVGAAANVDNGTAEYAVQTMVLVAFGAMVTILSFPFFSVAGAAAPALIIEIIHVGAAAVLAGGTASLVAVIELRRRRGESLRVMSMAGKFLNIAFLSLVLAFLTGFMLAVVELDGLSSFVQRGYGAASLLKILLTAVLAVALLRGRKDFKPGISDDAAAEFVGWLDNALRIGAAIGLAVLILSSWLTVAL